MSSKTMSSKTISNNKNGIIRQDLYTRLKKFSLRILKLADSLPSTPGSRAIANQISRSGISIAANYYEAGAASSNPHFIHYIEICEREARETMLWIELIIEAGYQKQPLVSPLHDECNEIIAMMVSIAKNAKTKS